MNPDSVCIIYFSRDGNTKTLAELLTDRIGACGMVRLQERSGRKGFFGFMRSGFQAVRRRSSVLEGDPWGASGDYTHLILMTPIWAGNGTPAMQAFLDAAQLDGKSVEIITVQADPKFGGIEKTHDYLKDLVTRHGGTVNTCIAMNGASPGKFAGERHLQREAERIIPLLQALR